MSRKSVLREAGDGYGHKDTAEYSTNDISSGTDRDGPFGTRSTTIILIAAANEKGRLEADQARPAR